MLQDRSGRMQSQSCSVQFEAYVHVRCLPASYHVQLLLPAILVARVCARASWQRAAYSNDDEECMFVDSIAIQTSIN
jgi:hypothetical protein